MANLDIHPEARAEANASLRYYEARSPKSARQFTKELAGVLAEIARKPDRFGYFERPFHEAALRKFPFSVVYRVGPGGGVTVFAVAHASREPGYWRDRAG